MVAIGGRTAASRGGVGRDPRFSSRSSRRPSLGAGASGSWSSSGRTTSSLTCRGSRAMWTGRGPPSSPNSCDTSRRGGIRRCTTEPRSGWTRAKTSWTRVWDTTPSFPARVPRRTSCTATRCAGAVRTSSAPRSASWVARTICPRGLRTATSASRVPVRSSGRTAAAPSGPRMNPSGTRDAITSSATRRTFGWGTSATDCRRWAG
mmetsp:Transcript_7666/g.31078  ORF Transcript_7666/g.31078 Transcript_7666/m.31078 type:complete len:205 (+) Transcript_7666:3-617(+)